MYFDFKVSNQLRLGFDFLFVLIAPYRPYRTIRSRINLSPNFCFWDASYAYGSHDPQTIKIN